MKKRSMKNLLAGMFFGLFMGVVVSCGNNKTVDSQIDYKPNLVSVQHVNGTVDIDKNKVGKVAVFDYGILDILENLGVDIAGLPKTNLPARFSKYNEDKYVNLGGLKEIDFESLNAMKPELIIISGRQADSYDKFSKIAPTLLMSVDGTKYMQDFKRNIETLTKIFGTSENQVKKLQMIEDKIKDINNISTTNKLNALTLMVNEGSLSTYGPGSRYGLIYNELGFAPLDEKVDESTHGQQVSFEYIVDKNPNYMFVIDRGAALGKEGTAKSILENDLVKSTDAYKNGRILYLDSQVWYTITGGLDSTLDMLNEIEGFVKNNIK